MDINSLKSQFSKYKKDLLDLNKYMYENPELGYQEIKSVNKITKLIKKHTADAKFKKFTDIPTAFIAEYSNGGPVIGFLGEYDALPGVMQTSSPFKEKVLLFKVHSLEIVSKWSHFPYNLAFKV